MFCCKYILVFVPCISISFLCKFTRTGQVHGFWLWNHHQIQYPKKKEKTLHFFTKKFKTTRLNKNYTKPRIFDIFLFLSQKLYSVWFVWSFDRKLSECVMDFCFHSDRVFLIGTNNRTEFDKNRGSTKHKKCFPSSLLSKIQYLFWVHSVKLEKCN